MREVLKSHINKLITFSDDDFENILPFFSSEQYKKKENILTKGNICYANHFVAKGCLRMFFINEKGIEQTTHFALENWWIADYTSFSTQQPATFSIQAIENSSVLSITHHDQEKMLEKFPVMERYIRLIHQRAQAASQFRVRGLYSLSREEAYHQFIDTYPEFVQRIPQYLLASFLGFTPEYLSEIRAKKRS